MADNASLADADAVNTNVVYAIYSLDEPERIRYVGLTSKTARKRLMAHWWKVNEGKSSPIHNFMRKHGWGKVRVRVLEICEDYETLNKREIDWIEHYRARGEADLNILSGGNQPSGHRRTEEQKIKLTLDRRAIYHERFAETVLEVREAVCVHGFTYAEVAELTGVGIQAVGHIMRNESWSHVPWAEGTQPSERKIAPYTQAQRDGIVRMYLAGHPWGHIEIELSVDKAQGLKHLGRADVQETYGPEIRAERERRKKSKYEITARKLQGGTSKISEETVSEIKFALWSGSRQSDVSERFGLSRGVVGAISRNISWTHVPWPIGPRPRPIKATGAGSSNAKFTEEMVRSIRQRGVSERYADLAAEFGVSITSVSHIVSRRSWSHVLD